jgi:hypothetical protein
MKKTQNWFPHLHPDYAVWNWSGIISVGKTTYSICKTEYHQRIEDEPERAGRGLDGGLFYELVYRDFQFLYALRLVIAHRVDYAVFEVLYHDQLARVRDG